MTGEHTGAATQGALGPGDRSLDLTLARVHLRTGALGLARAELEAMAGRGTLDDAGLLDLAEARWRTGDLPGAGEAARAYLGSGGRATIALVMAAESTLAVGRPGEARTLVGRALEALDGPLDVVFAGMPRSPIWPSERVLAPPEELPDGEGLASGDGGPSATASQGSPSVAGHESLPDPAAVLATGRTALADGDLDAALVSLGLALRLGPGLATTVLELLEPVEPSVAVSLLRGDALRAAGHEPEAVAAYAAAARALAAAPDGRDG